VEIAEFRTLLGIDVIDSARTPAHLLNAVPDVVRRVLETAMERAGIARSDEVVERQFTGDGFLIALPSSVLGGTVDLGRHLDQIVAEHNMWHKPEVRLRLAVEVGPLPDEPGFSASAIARSRLLEAPAFKQLMRRCAAERPEAAPSTGMILSDPVFRTVFGADHVKLAKSTDFTRIPVVNKEFEMTAWVSVPGFDTTSLATFLAADEAAAEQSEGQGGTVNNTVIGTNSGVQAHTITGGITFGRTP
jgi:hypothetical protein